MDYEGVVNVLIEPCIVARTGGETVLRVFHHVHSRSDYIKIYLLGFLMLWAAPESLGYLIFHFA